MGVNTSGVRAAVVSAVAAVGLAISVGGAIAAPGTECPPGAEGGAYPGATCVAVVSSSQVEPGQVITVSGAGFSPGTAYQIAFGNLLLAQGTVPQSGVVTESVRIPANAAPGRYTLAIRGTDFSGGPRVLTSTLTVVGERQPATSVGAGPETTGLLPATGF